jgi:hypothetical protein
MRPGETLTARDRETVDTFRRFLEQAGEAPDPEAGPIGPSTVPLWARLDHETLAFALGEPMSSANDPATYGMGV